MIKKYIILVLMFSFFSFVSATQAATLSLSPSSGNYTVGDTFNVSVILNTQGAETSGTDIYYLNFNPSLLEVQTITPGSLYANTNANSIDNVSGKINFSQTSDGSATYNGSGTLATISFKALSAGIANATFDFTADLTTDSNVASGSSDVLSAIVNASFSISSPAGGGDEGGGGGGGGGGGIPPTADTAAPADVVDLIAVAENGKVVFSWTNPTDSDFQGVMIRRKQSDFPSGKTDGTQIYKGSGTDFTDTDLTNGTTYHYAIFTYDEVPNYSNGVKIKTVPNIGEVSSSNEEMTIEELKVKIAWLLDQIAKIQALLVQLRGGETVIAGIPTGYSFTENLWFNQYNKNVKYLQIFLKSQGTAIYPEGKTTGYFGPLTKKAVIRFQDKYALEILSPWNLTKGNGFVGPSTRAKINRLMK